MSMAEASFHDSLTNSISPVRIVKISIYAPCQGCLFPCIRVWPMLAGKAHTGPQKGGQRGIYLPGQCLGNVPGSVSTRSRYRGQGRASASAKMYIFAMLAVLPPERQRPFLGASAAYLFGFSHERTNMVRPRARCNVLTPSPRLLCSQKTDKVSIHDTLSVFSLLMRQELQF